MEYYYKRDEGKLLEYFQILDKNASIPSKIPFDNQHRYERLIDDYGLIIADEKSHLLRMGEPL
ncbi:hypothetical protein [Oceanobacillus locisalsi]|uniref:Uncharacterized protein n=1 Tax=Oceanobacillus locisalsi TaxID=546107 RepID=A0ABW3NMV4_9BACI